MTEFCAQIGGQAYDFYDYVSFNRVAGFLVLKDKMIAHESYHLGNSARTRWLSMSIAKSITATLIGAAIKDGFIGSLDDRVTQYVHALEASAFEDVTVRQILQMSSGMTWNETYTDPKSDRRRMLEAQIEQDPGKVLDVLKGLRRCTVPGSKWNYSTGETQVAAMLLASATGESLSRYLSRKIWVKFGMEANAEWWLESPDGLEIGGSGISATLRDYGRFGQFLLDEGNVNREQVLPTGWIKEATRPQRVNEDSEPYGFMFWPVATSEPGDLHAGAYEAQGIFGQRIYVNPRENLVIVVLCAWPKPWLTPPIDDHLFFKSIIESLRP